MFVFELCGRYIIECQNVQSSDPPHIDFRDEFQSHPPLVPQSVTLSGEDPKPQEKVRVINNRLT